MLAGMREPNVIKSGLVDQAEKNLKLLDREIEQVKLEMELQRSINGNTALAAITQQMNEQMFAVDDNNLGNGNRRFANLSKEAGSNNITGNVNGATSQAVGTRYIAIPKSDGTGMSDFYGTYAANTAAYSNYNNTYNPNYNGTIPTNSISAKTAKEFVQQTLPIAKEIEAKYGIPADFVIAQSALETGWGGEVEGNAYFGVKGKSPSGKSVNIATTECLPNCAATRDNFRAYDSYGEAADDWARMLVSGRFKGAM